jgi:hypothetical protein
VLVLPALAQTTTLERKTVMPEAKSQPVRFFLNVDALIKTGPDGYPEYHECSGLELTILDRAATKVIRLLANREEISADEASVLRLARTDTAWLAAMKRGDRDPALADARFKARGELVETNV